MMETDLKLQVIPFNEDLENSVLGVLILEPDSICRVIDRLSEDVFYSKNNQILFKAVFSLFKAGKSTDMLSISQYVLDRNLMPSDQVYLHIANVTNSVVGSSALEDWVEALISDYTRRELSRKAARIYYSCFDMGIDSRELTGSAIDGITKIIQRTDPDPEKGFGDVLIGVVNEMRKSADSPGSVIGEKTFFDFLDKNLSGLVAPDLTVIAARPGMGKTTLALNIALNMAKAGVPVGFFSFEMKDRQLIWKILSRELGETVSDIRKGNMGRDKWDLLGRVFDKLKNIPLYLNDRGFMTTTEMKAKVKTWIAKYGIKAVFGDYLQLIGANREMRGQNREAIVSANTRDIKNICMDCDIPFVLLSQLSRQGANTEPELHHLRECIPVDEWIYTPTGVMKIGDKPKEVCTSSNNEIINSSCSFITKKYNRAFLVKTQFGDFRATANHLVLTGTGWKKVRDLNIERDVVASPKKISHSNKGYLPHGRLLGWLLGNGYLKGTPMLVYRRELDEDVRKEIKPFNVEITYRKKQKSANVFEAYLSNPERGWQITNPLMAWIRDLGLENHTAFDKFIPEKYLGTSDETHRDILRGLWETDGTVTRGIAKYTTVSELLGRQTRWLLLTIGVRSTINRYGNLWEIRCSCADNHHMEYVVSNKKRFNNLKIPSEKYIDPAPAIFSELANEYNTNTSFRFQKKLDNNRHKMISKSRFKVFLKNNPIETIKESPFMKYDHIGWGRIHSIIEEPKDVRVCDLGVMNTHNFIIGGVVVHNSGAIEQDADNIIFIHMDEDATAREYPGWVEGDPEWIVKLMIKKGRLVGTGTRQMILNGANNVFKPMEFKSNFTPISSAIRNYYETDKDENPF